MPLEKIADWPRLCRHPEHNPPNSIVLEPGTYRHTCPGCGEITIFTVAGNYCASETPVGASCLPEGFITQTGFLPSNGRRP